MPFNRTWSRWTIWAVQGFCAAVVFCATLWTVWAIGPAIERTYQPVVSKLEILSSIQLEDNVTEIQARFKKLRDCKYVSVSWYVGNPNGEFRQVRVQTITDAAETSDEYNPTRPVGWVLAGPWRIGMSIDDLQHNSFALLTHQCHPFWMTTTLFYP